MIYCKYCQVVIVLFNDRDGGVSSRFFFVFVFFLYFFCFRGGVVVGFEPYSVVLRDHSGDTWRTILRGVCAAG